MTVAELIAELRKWPADDPVEVAPFVPPPSCVDGASIHHVSGLAGGHISGRDSAVVIFYGPKDA